MYCTNCGKEIPQGIKFCPHCGVQVSGVQVSPAAPTARSSYAYNPIPSAIVILTDILVIISFFIPWVTIGVAGYPGQSYSPLRILQEGGVAWWVHAIPLAVLVAGFLELLLQRFQVLSKGKLRWKTYWYFTDGIAYILCAIIWWVLVMYAPALEYQGMYFSLKDYTYQGIQAGFGAGLILLIIAGVLEIVAGITTLAMRRT